MMKIDTVELKRKALDQIRTQLKSKFVIAQSVESSDQDEDDIYDIFCYGECSDCCGVI